MELTAYVPIANTTMAKYRAPVLSVAQPRTKPKTAMALAMVMCHVRSLNRPDDHDQSTEMTPAIKYGGQVRTNVISLLKPRVSTAVGKKFLNPFAAKCICCMNAKSHSFGSLAASLRPAIALVLVLWPTVSFVILDSASCRCSGDSHFVVSGLSGRVRMERQATRKVAAPWIMNSHCQPVMPALPLSSKMPRAMRPAKAVARMFPVYKIEIRVAISFRAEWHH